MIPPRADWDGLPDPYRKLISTFVEGFRELGQGISVEQAPSKVTVRLDQSPGGAIMRLASTSNTVRDRRTPAPFDGDLQRHQNLLEFLDNHPLVRSVDLPGIVVRSAGPPVSLWPRPDHVPLPIRNT